MKRGNVWALILITCIAIALCAQVSALATTYYVSTTGDDTWDGLSPTHEEGTSSGPWKSIDYGDKNSKVATGDTVKVLAGTYDMTGLGYEPVYIMNVPGVTYKAEGEVIISRGTDSGRLVRIGAADTIFDGFILDGGYHILLVWNGSGITIRNCIMRNGGSTEPGNAGFAVYFGGWSNNITFCNNLIYNVLPNTYGALVTDNSSGDMKFYNNTVIVPGTNAYISVLFGGGSSASTYFKNNIVVGGSYGMYDAPGCIHSYNMFYGCGTTFDGVTKSAGIGETTDVDPALTADYHLSATSPAIDAGAYVGLPFNGAKPDLGAFEADGTPGQVGSISGTITSAVDNTPVANATVQILNGTSVLTETKSGTDGAYNITWLPGTYTLKVVSAGFPNYTQPVEIINNQTTQVDIVLGSGMGSVVGHVLDIYTSSPLTGATVRLIQDGQIISSTTVDDQGAYKFAAPAGSYTVAVAYGGYDPNSVDVTLADSQMQTVDINLTPRDGSPKTFYVSPTGNDLNDGLGEGDDSAWQSLDNGDKHKFLAAGDKVIVLEGTYDLSAKQVIVLENCSGYEDSPITYEARGKVVLDAGTRSSGILKVNGPGAEYIIIDGFQFKGGGSPMLFLYNGEGNVVRNCDFSGGGVPFGVYFLYGTNSAYYNNVMHDMKSWTYGLMVESVYGFNKFYNNTFVDPGHTWIYSACFGKGDLSYCEFKNNIIKGSNGGIYECAGGIVHSNNIISGCSINYDGPGAHPGDFETVTTDPCLAADYSLQSYSPAIDAGIDVGLPYSGTAPDLGAFESSESIGSPGTVSGTVKDAATGAPIANASVEVKKDGQLEMTIQTDANGAFSAWLQPGDYSFNGKAVGYNAVEKTASIASSQDTQVDFELTKVVGGRTFYVSTTGNDANDGTAPDDAHAWKTIDHGDKAVLLVPGDIVTVLEGTYDMTGFGYQPIYLGNVSGVTYKAQGEVIIARGTEAGRLVRIGDGASNTVFDGFILDGGYHILLIWNGNGITIRNCVFRNGGGTEAGQVSYAIFLAGGTQNVTFNNNLIYGIKPATDSVLAAWSVTDSKFFNNVFYNADYSAYNTVLFSNGDTPSTQFRNNIVVGGMMGMWNGTGIVHSNNLYYNCSTSVGNSDLGDGEIVGVDPMLMADYHLMWGSPAIDSGVDVGLPFNGAAPDMGAYEVAAIPAGAGTISGVVSEAVTNDPVAGAQIVVELNGQSLTTQTNAEGKYSIPADAGNQSIAVSATGYVSASQVVNVPTGGAVTANIVLTANEVPFVTDSIGNLRDKTDGVVKITKAVVTSASNSFVGNVIYVEDETRAAGIKVIVPAGNPALTEGERVAVRGRITSVDGEKVIEAVYVKHIEDGQPLRPLGVTNKSVVGSGAPVTGLLVKIWGSVTGITEDGSYAYIDDGSGINDGNANGFVGIGIALSRTNDLGLATAVKVGDKVSITGLVGHDANGIVIRPRGAVDIVNNQDQHIVLHANEIGVAGDGSSTEWKIQNYGPYVESGEPGPSQSTITFVNNGIQFYHADNEQGVGIRCNKYAGLPLNQLTNLRFAEFINTPATASANRTMLVVLNVDTNDDGTYDQFLYYEPYYHQSNPLGGVVGAWQEWDALNGLWSCYDKDGNIQNGMTRETPKSLTDYLTAYPDAKLDKSANGGLRVFTGVLDFGLCTGLVCTLDDVTVGTANGGTTVYSFQP